MSDSSLQGRTVVLAHATGAIGQAVSTVLAEVGAHLVLGSLNEATLERLAADVAAAGARVASVPMLPGAPGQRHLLERATAAFGCVDAYVACPAPLPASTAAESLALESFIAGLNATLDEPFFGCQGAARQMLAQPNCPHARDSARGVVLAVTSVAADVGFAGHAALCAGQTGLAAALKSLAVEWAPIGVRVVNVAAGLAPDFVDGVRPLPGAASRVPPAALVSPERVARAVRFALSDEGDAICGVPWHVDGGWLADGYWEPFPA